MIIHRENLEAGVIEIIDNRTPEQKAEQALAERTGQVKAICRAAIYGAVSQQAQANLAAAKSMDILEPDEEDAYADFFEWVNDMRVACGAIIADGARDPTDAAEWPLCPSSVAELAAEY